MAIRVSARLMSRHLGVNQNCAWGIRGTKDVGILCCGQVLSGGTLKRVADLLLLATVVYSVGCSNNYPLSVSQTTEVQGDLPGDAVWTEETERIVENLTLADFPEEEIGVLKDGTVFVGLDAIVTLESSREMANSASLSNRRQYSTSNLIDRDVSVICVRPSSAFTPSGVLGRALEGAVKSYNDQGLRFTLQIGGSGCSASIEANTQQGNGGSAGFPYNGRPYGKIFIGSQLANGPVRVAKHVIMHEIGHTIGFRHSDYYDRSISCDKPGNEGDTKYGADRILGTPATATKHGSVMNSCYSTDTDGQWTSTDVIALRQLYDGS